jgi:hypothetical protein
VLICTQSSIAHCTPLFCVYISGAQLGPRVREVLQHVAEDTPMTVERTMLTAASMLSSRYIYCHVGPSHKFRDIIEWFSDCLHVGPSHKLQDIIEWFSDCLHVSICRIPKWICTKFRIVRTILSFVNRLKITEFLDFVHR